MHTIGRLVTYDVLMHRGSGVLVPEDGADPGDIAWTKPPDSSVIAALDR